MGCLCINLKKKLKKPKPYNSGEQNTEIQNRETTPKQQPRQRQSAPRANYQIVVQPHKLPLPIPKPQDQQKLINHQKQSTLQQPEPILGKPFEDIKEKYSLGRELGRGQFGITYICTEISSGKKFACKSILKRKLIRTQARTF